MIVDGLASGIINLILFAAMVLFFKITNEKDYTPSAWIGVNKYDVKLFFLGMLLAILYKLTIGFIEIINGNMIFTVDPPGITESLIAFCFSSFGFLGVALFEEGFFRGYLMQVILKRYPTFLAISIQAVIFGLIHYFNYLGSSHIWIEIMDAILIGLIFGVIVVKTKSLMLVIGAHLMYNVAETIIFIDSHEFSRAIYFNSTLDVTESFLYLKFLELILLSAIFVLLVFLFRKEVFHKNNSSGVSL